MLLLLLLERLSLGEAVGEEGGDPLGKEPEETSLSKTALALEVVQTHKEYKAVLAREEEALDVLHVQDEGNDADVVVCGLGKEGVNAVTVPGREGVPVEGLNEVLEVDADVARVHGKVLDAVLREPEEVGEVNGPDVGLNGCHKGMEPTERDEERGTPEGLEGHGDTGEATVPVRLLLDVGTVGGDARETGEEMGEGMEETEPLLLGPPAPLGSPPLSLTTPIKTLKRRSRWRLGRSHWMCKVYVLM